MTIPPFILTGGIALPAVGFGTYLIASDDAATAVSTAISVGYRHVDTAAVYENEVGVGAGLREGMSAAGLARADVFVTTKLWPGNPAWGEEVKGRDDTVAAGHKSLELLGLDYVDLYLIHSPHGGADNRVAQWEGVLELKRTGKVRAVGVSNYSQAHLEEIAAAGLEMPAVNQIELHPWSQKPELIAFMKKHGIFPMAYSSLAPLSTWRVEPGQDSAKSADMKDDGTFHRLAAKYSVTEAQLLLRWGVQKGYAILPKSLNADRMKQNLALDGFTIDDADMETLAALDRGPGLAWSVGDPVATQ